MSEKKQARELEGRSKKERSEREDSYVIHASACIRASQVPVKAATCKHSQQRRKCPCCLLRLQQDTLVPSREIWNPIVSVLKKAG